MLAVIRLEPLNVSYLEVSFDEVTFEEDLVWVFDKHY